MGNMKALIGNNDPFKKGPLIRCSYPSSGLSQGEAQEDFKIMGETEKKVLPCIRGLSCRVFMQMGGGGGSGGLRTRKEPSKKFVGL